MSCGDPSVIYSRRQSRACTEQLVRMRDRATFSRIHCFQGHLNVGQSSGSTAAPDLSNSTVLVLVHLLSTALRTHV